MAENTFPLVLSYVADLLAAAAEFAMGMRQVQDEAKHRQGLCKGVYDTADRRCVCKGVYAKVHSYSDLSLPLLASGCRPSAAGRP
jgi:hypothetical protein